VRRLSAAVFAVGAASACLAQDDGIRGPLAPREEWLLAQPRLVLAAVAPDPLAPGRTTLRARFDWGNDFGWSQQHPGELPGDRRFLVDGEHRALDLEMRRGLAPRLDFGLRLPLRWRGPGVLDGVIDWWHGFTSALGLPDNLRSQFLNDRFRVEGRDSAGAPLRWTEAGTGLGNLEADARWALARSADGRSRAALVGRAMLPTATAPFATGSLGGGLQLVGARAAGGRWDFQAGVGGSVESKTEIEGIRYARGRVHGFLAGEWRTGRRFSLLGETSAASRLVTNLAAYPGLQWYLNLGARMNLDSGWTIEGGFSENIAQQQSTTDFAIQVGLTRRLR
jgi:hypothetical protein